MILKISSGKSPKHQHQNYQNPRLYDMFCFAQVQTEPHHARAARILAESPAQAARILARGPACAAKRWWQVSDRAGVSTRFVHRESFSGALVPFVRRRLDTVTRANFETTDVALKKRAEATMLERGRALSS